MFCLSKAVQEHNSGNSNKREPRIVHENLTPAVDKKAWSRCIFAQQPNRSKQHSHIQQQSWPTGPPKPKKKQKQKYHQRQKSTELAHRAALKTQQQSWPDTRYKTNQRQKTPETKNTRDKKHQRQKITRDENQKQEKTQQSMKGRNRWLWVKTPYPWFPHH